MLTQLTIQNYAIVETLDLELKQGMTVISGETGAGKSIMLDALGLALGGRADKGSVRPGAKKAEISARFDLAALPGAAAWLEANDLQLDEHDTECLIRRVITHEGRSRTYINGQPCPMALLRELGEQLVNIHGQHEHQRLMRKEFHCTLLDEFAGQQAAVAKLGQAYRDWQAMAKRLERSRNQNDEDRARVQLLSYQLEELAQLALAEGELAALEKELAQLEGAEHLLMQGQQLLNLTTDSDEGNCIQLLNQALHCLEGMSKLMPQAGQVREMLNSAVIQIDEAGSEVRHFLDGVAQEPQRQQEVEQRLSAIYDLARKHRIQAEQLPEFQAGLQSELDSLECSDEALEQMEAECQALQQIYQQQAEKLSKARHKAAAKLSQQVDAQLHQLGMPAAHFDIALRPLDQPSAKGLEEVEFMISANRGQPSRPLAKVASGGELSRVSLAIQVITAQTSATPTLVFDEVDVGIGGAIAEVVGRMLRDLGKRAQILCVTHQPQVASQGHQHLYVCKEAKAKSTQTRIQNLSVEGRVEEVARMLGGIDITHRSIEHAREMLGSAAKA